MFFPAVVIIYFLLERKRGSEVSPEAEENRRLPAFLKGCGLSNLWLLVSSYFYYMCADARFALLLLFVTATTYAAGLVTGNESADKRKKKMALAAGTIANILILFFFKYFNLLAGLFSEDPALKVVLPVGISFYIFQSLTYLFDTYKGKCPIERNFLKYALFVSFFPVLLAGPIERATHLLPQFDKVHHFDYERIRHGLIRMAYGYFLKLVIAQRLAIAVDLIYDNSTECTGYQLFLGSVLFVIQIYCDFASYSSIAIGAAEVMGFTLTENFRQPFLAVSCGEQWRRWHISLNGWFRDYVYIPLGGSRHGRFRKYLNVMIVFTLSGAWHGAELHYLCWGALAGFFQVMEDILKPLRERIVKGFPIHNALTGRLHHILQILLTFFLFVISAVFFRAASVADGVYITKKMWTDFEWNSIFTTSPFDLGLGVFHLLFVTAGLVMMIIYSLINEKKDAAAVLLSQKTAVRWGIYYLVVIMILGSTSIGAQQFIYFAF